jgi:hypothetical protein
MERSSRTTVRFLHPFYLAEVDGPQPAGIYEVETLEQQLEGVSFIAYRRVSTTIILRHPTSNAYQVAAIDPKDLAAALEMDARAGEPPELTTNYF